MPDRSMKPFAWLLLAVVAAALIATAGRADTDAAGRADPGIVKVIYEVVERPPARVGQIILLGNERIRQNVILRQVPLRPGQALAHPAPGQSEANLSRTNIFETNARDASR